MDELFLQTADGLGRIQTRGAPCGDTAAEKIENETCCERPEEYRPLEQHSRSEVGGGVHEVVIGEKCIGAKPRHDDACKQADKTTGECDEQVLGNDFAH